MFAFYDRDPPPFLRERDRERRACLAGSDDDKVEVGGVFRRTAVLARTLSQLTGTGSIR